jgi:hypothetical protein
MFSTLAAVYVRGEFLEVSFEFGDVLLHGFLLFRSDELVALKRF